MPKRNEKGATPLKHIGPMIQTGVSLAFPVVISVIVGKYLDERLDTGNTSLIVSIMIGVLVSFGNLYRQARKMTGKK